MIKGLKNLGIKTIRIPVSWHNHISDNNYSIDSSWMSRVKQIVDWAYNEEMYVIINIHHDNYNSKNNNFKYGKGFYPSEEYKTESLKFITRVWEQICQTFNENYDDRLVFEVLNEPRLQGDAHEWGYQSSCATCKEAMNVLNEFNQAALDTIRASGGNNSTRLVMIPSIAASPDNAFNGDFKMPEDSAENALALSVHMYTPYNFAMGTPNGGEKFTSGDKGTLDYYFNKLNNMYASKGIPVIIGETGVPRIIDGKNNNKNLYESMKHYATISGKYSMPMIFWDAGGLNTIDRDNCKPFDLEFVDTVVSAWNNIN
jgi:endoglucanase